MMIFFNQSTKGNYKKANELFDEACNAGNMEGCWALGLMYYASGNPKDKIKASL